MKVAYHILWIIICRYVRKNKGSPQARLTPNYANRKIFSEEQEQALESYLVTCAKMFYGLTIIDCRKLAFEMAIKNNLATPPNWNEKKMSGIEWMRGFLTRHPKLSLCHSEPCSLSRATSFNQHNLNLFYDNLVNAMKRS